MRKSKTLKELRDYIYKEAAEEQQAFDDALRRYLAHDKQLPEITRQLALTRDRLAKKWLQVLTKTITEDEKRK
jgi:hypothetical protein